MIDPEKNIKEESPTAEDVFKALSKTTHYLHQKFETQLTDHEIPEYLTGPRLRVLNVILESDKIRMSDLASKLGIKARTVTQFVDVLEKENLLARLPDPDDRRATLLQLTDMAVPLIKRVRSITDEIVEELFAPLPPEKRIQLLDILSSLVDYKNVCIFDDKKQ
ncbi:MarR family transcriptional regulator [Staphylococcus gallinarum]|uniref:MarR family winged helix-turn-helix transcriptional regulator n=1 Tax=Staphylococcus gallinarum TaxID=1293 RepID=UPI002DBF5386|nr:MarR family transcriptional regulator [Staphylococcus gallinarum]MEB6238781.1 MarR family transcriptional regulator [Staphylococcus gallinarum]